MRTLTSLSAIVSIAILAIIFGCSGGGTPVAPDNTVGSLDTIPIIGLSDADGICSATGLFGAYELTINPDDLTVDLVSKRISAIGEDYLVSGIGFFTVAPCTSCLYFNSMKFNGMKLVLNFGIEHPFDPGNPGEDPTALNRLDLDVFDLAMVIVPSGAIQIDFPLTGETINVGALSNPDGYTTELENLLDDEAAMPYVLVIDDADTGISTWNKFGMGADSFFDVVFDVGPGSTLNFDMYLTMGYGFSAKKPDRLDPKYYNPEFNRNAAWKVEAKPLGVWLNSDPVTPTFVEVKVYDWQIGATVSTETDFGDADPGHVYAASEIESVSVEILGMSSVLPTVPGSSGIGTGMPGNPKVFMIPIANENLLPAGEYIALIKVLDERETLTPAEGRDYLIDAPDGVTLEDVELEDFSSYQSMWITVVAEGIRLEQISYEFDGQVQEFSSYGSVEIGFIGPLFPKYFNLSVNGMWVIQNIPLLPHAGPDVPQTVTMGFDLGTPPGMPVPAVSAGWDITDTPQGAPPAEEPDVPVEPRPTSGGSGRSVEEPAPPITVPDPVNEYGDELDGENFAVHGTAFPNKDCGTNECVPTAVSNSLEFLQNTTGSPPAGKPTDIGTMKTATNWSPGTPTRSSGSPEGWADTKRQYMDDNGYGITTEEHPDPDDMNHEATAAECDAAMQAIRDGKDVEVNGGHHTAAVVGMAKLANDCYVMYVAHDTRQGEDGGCRIEKIIYCPDSPNPRASGGAPGFFGGDKINGFTVESKTPTP